MGSRLLVLDPVVHGRGLVHLGPRFARERVVLGLVAAGAFEGIDEFGGGVEEGVDGGGVAEFDVFADVLSGSVTSVVSADRTRSEPSVSVPVTVHLSLFLTQPDEHGGCGAGSGVLQDVGQRLLRDAVGGQVETRRQRR